MRILTGLQPSGKLHVGNYFGAMEPAVRLQDEGEAFYFIANYHAMTTVKNPDELRAFTRELAVDFLACGLDPERSVFFLQSAVPEVNELAWILSTVCPMGLLAKCHSYKDKTSQGLQGDFTTEAGLNQLLAGTGLGYVLYRQWVTRRHA